MKHRFLQPRLRRSRQHLGTTAHPVASSSYSLRFPWFVPQFITAASGRDLGSRARNPKREFSLRRSGSGWAAFC